MAERPGRLLAKRPYLDGRMVTLEAHSLDCERAALRLFSGESRWAQSFARFFRLTEEPLRRRMLLNLRVACLFHDIGKANEDFYAAVSKPGHWPQTIRHEHLSALVLMLPEMRAWLEQNPDIDVDIVTAAVLSHHLKASDHGNWKFCQASTRPTLPIYLDHPEVHSLLARIRHVASLPAPPALPTNAWGNRKPWSVAFQAGMRSARFFGHGLRNEDRLSTRHMMLLAVKSGLIAADSAASGLVREGHDLNEWIDHIVRAAKLGSSDIESGIIAKRAADIEKQRGAPFKLHAFQVEAATAGSRLLLLAACAAGKTLAAWNWAAEQARNHDIGRIVFLYPTRGTATEGFRDYVAWAPEAESALVHGTARYELEAMQENPSEAMRGKALGPSEADERLYSLGFWSRRWFSATVDQFFGFMEHHYGSLCLLPVLADAAVIVDEVHSFDRHMFDTLIAFLRAFDVPVLCMTATLPPSRRAELEAAGLRVYPTEAERAVLEDLEKAERHPRYRIERVANAEQALEKAVEAFKAGRRVLWVVNTVARCQVIASSLREALGKQPLVYHSRFRLMDRQRIHADVVKQFRMGTEGAPAIAVTTQVCEMSLDLDADVLITEIAPIPSLVQRFGRANRHLARGGDFRATLYIYAPPSAAPYEREDLKRAEGFLDELSASDCSQYDLTLALEKHVRQEREPDGWARFLDSGYFATPGKLRDTEDFAHACVLDSDLPHIADALGQNQPIDGFVLSVPRSQLMQSPPRPPRLPRWLAIAPGSQYDEAQGFLNQERAHDPIC